MGKRSSLPAHIAYVEDADEDGHVVSGAEPKYARSTAPGSPRRQQPNTSKARRESRRNESYSSADSSDSTAHPSTSKGKSRMKPKDDKRSGAVVVSKQRPTVRSSKTTPAPVSRASDESSYYTVPHHASSSRPRAHTRPESYYGQSTSRPPRPPISTSAYYQQPPPPNMVPPSFPPPSWAVPLPGPMPPHPPPPTDHHFARDLAMRFRPSSAMGFRQASNPYEYEPAPEKSITRRSSVSRKASKESKNHEDRKRMPPPPPPPRPKSTRPERVVLRPQASSNMRKSVVFDDDDQDSESSLYPTTHRRESGVEYGSSPFKNRRQSFEASESIFDYEEDDFDEPAPRSRSRRGSRLGIEDKIRDASRYQDTVGSGPPALTAEALRHVKNGGSSRSTRSSASRDESDYKHSATTHTTRSSSGEDDITIKVPVGAIVEVGNTKIHCRDGGDISVGRVGTSRSGSDRGTSIYGDDRRSRSDRSSSARTRASSQAAFARGLPAPGGHAPVFAPSPLYSKSYYGEDDYF
ncbi:hypothetical protein F5Y19DRAFT_163111 [Xylariaceae sp. FL1651]|nr:hypothetical protein F5Y19DRAFT_163111 [Xylariaceae sp. FL1651]